ncbi:MAG TPA: DUF1330 domain-containing protein [Casimicrobiaceae bacterium]|nr:DUF1330 domain-containing protein [Casimicrobiaceae bacterium]
MPAYLVADIEVTDPEGYAECRRTVGESIAAFGGRFLARGGKTVTLEGNWSPSRLVIVEFPSIERLQAWYDSPDYAPALALRKRASVGSLVMTEGI